jgi:hypothetical protein
MAVRIHSGGWTERRFLPGCASCTGIKSSNSQNSTSGCPRIALVCEGHKSRVTP